MCQVNKVPPIPACFKNPLLKPVQIGMETNFQQLRIFVPFCPPSPCLHQHKVLEDVLEHTHTHTDRIQLQETSHGKVLFMQPAAKDMPSSVSFETVQMVPGPGTATSTC